MESSMSESRDDFIMKLGALTGAVATVGNESLSNIFVEFLEELKNIKDVSWM